MLLALHEDHLGVDYGRELATFVECLHDLLVVQLGGRRRRVHAELTKARGIQVSVNLVTVLMHNAGIAGLPGPAKVRRIKGTPTSDDLVERRFARSELDELWVTDITEHRSSRRQGVLLRRVGHL